MTLFCCRKSSASPRDPDYIYRVVAEGIAADLAEEQRLLHAPTITRTSLMNFSIKVTGLVDTALYANQCIELPTRYMLGENFFDRNFAPRNIALFSFSFVASPFFFRTLLNAYERGTGPVREDPPTWLSECGVWYKTLLKTYGSAAPVLFSLLRYVTDRYLSSPHTIYAAAGISGVLVSLLVLPPTCMGEHIFLNGTTAKAERYIWPGYKKYSVIVGYAFSSAALSMISLDGLPAHLRLTSEGMLSLMSEGEYLVNAFCAVNLLCFVFNFLAYFRQAQEGFIPKNLLTTEGGCGKVISVLSGVARGAIASSSLSAMFMSLADFAYPFMEESSPLARILMISLLTFLFFVLTLPANMARFSPSRQLPSCVSRFFLTPPPAPDPDAFDLAPHRTPPARRGCCGM